MEGCGCNLVVVFWLAALPVVTMAEDLGIVRIKTPAEPGRPSGYFTAAHIGRGVLLTCGHCCKYAGGSGSPVEVQILSREERSPYRTEAGTVACFEAEADLGLIRFNRPDALSIAYAVAPRDYRVQPGLHVVQYTWKVPGGTLLRSVRSEVTNVNQFVGPENIETRFAPVQGDSGAPVVSERDGLIIAVTTGADLYGRFGVHAGPTAIDDLFRQCDIHVRRSNLMQASQATISGRTDR